MASVIIPHRIQSICSYPLSPPKQTPLFERIRRVASACFAALVAFLTFPLRYIGSKSWSLPGVILRAPYALFRRIFCKSDISLSEELFGSGYHSQFEKKLSPNELRPYLTHACATGFVHRARTEYIPHGWTLVLPKEISLDLQSIHRHARVFSDPQSGFKAALLEKGNELMIPFGALDVDQQHLSFFQKVRGQGNAIRSLCGLSPKVFDQAADFVSQITANPRFKNKKITLVGNCYGGSLASYAALKCLTKAVCFNTFPLGAGEQYKIGNEALQAADEYITHITAKNDFVSDPSIGITAFDALAGTAGIRTPGNFGRRFWIPTPYTNSVDVHTNMLGSIMFHLTGDVRKPPNELLKNI